MLQNSKYKDSLFRFIYGREENKRYLLSLYNALTGSNCTDENELEITTIENVIYVSRKNDVSFMIGSDIYLFEHQSTYNPNMPLRGLMYFSQLYNKLIEGEDKDLYTKTLLKIPAPNFYVFYNGEDDKPDRVTLRLSDAFDHPAEGFEWTATMLNINFGHNNGLLEKCKSLQDYAMYVRIHRQMLESGLKGIDAVNAAVSEAKKLDLLDGFFKRHSKEVLNMLLTDFDQEAYDRRRRREGREEMQPIIDRQAAENAAQAKRIAELEAQLAQYQKS